MSLQVLRQRQPLGRRFCTGISKSCSTLDICHKLRKSLWFDIVHLLVLAFGLFAKSDIDRLDCVEKS